MSNRQQFIPLDECINHYLNESEQSNHKYYKLWQIAFRGMDDMGLDFFYQIKSIRLPVNANKTVTLPEDYLNYTKVGILNGRGEVVPLSHNSKLATYADLFTDRVSKVADDSLFNLYNPSSDVWYNYWDGDGYINLYGIPSGTPEAGNFKIDTANGVIILNLDYSFDYIILEYLSSPNEGQEYRIPIQFREAMIAWLSWKDSNNRPANSHFNLGDKRDKRHEYFNERRLAKARYSPFNIQEAYDWNLKNQRMTIKG
jgi:hypothetical protein